MLSMRSLVCPVARGVALAPAFVLALGLVDPSWGSAEQPSIDAGHKQVRVAVERSMADSAELADEQPAMQVSLVGGYFIRDDLEIAIGGSADVLDDAADTYVAFAQVAAYTRAPLIRPFVAAGAGYYWTEVRGSDYVFNDRGARFSADAGFHLAIPYRSGTRFIVEPSMYVSYDLSHSIHHARNSSYPAWTHALWIGVAIAMR